MRKAYILTSNNKLRKLNYDKSYTDIEGKKYYIQNNSDGTMKVYHKSFQDKNIKYEVFENIKDIFKEEVLLKLKRKEYYVIKYGNSYMCYYKGDIAFFDMKNIKSIPVINICSFDTYELAESKLIYDLDVILDMLELDLSKLEIQCIPEVKKDVQQ